MTQVKEKQKKYQEKGITLLALVITIIVLLILAGVTVSSLLGDSGIIKNATEVQILTELSNVKEALELYKFKNYSDGDMSDEELVQEGLLKEVFIKDTYRTLAIITDLEKINITSKFGKGGEKQKNTEEDTLLNMYNVYGIDMSDGTLYYIRDGIWSIEGEKVTYIASTGEEKEGYVIETIDQKYIEDKKFITEWTVTAGTTITLPIRIVPNITIEWGDGTEEVCTTVKPTHTYEQSGTYEIKIKGDMKEWTFNSINTSKDYITRIKQWGSVGGTSINFNGCTNLAGTIPSHKLENEFSKMTNVSQMFLDCTKLTGSIPEDLFLYSPNISTFNQAFYGCTGLTGKIPEKLFEKNTKASSFTYTFTNCTGLTGEIPAKLFEKNTKANNFENIFSNCTGLTGEIPAQLFENNKEITSLLRMFHHCKGISGKIPEGLLSNCSKITDVSLLFADTSITEIPANLFDINNGQPNGIKSMTGVFENTQISTIPTGLFDLCTEVTSFGTTGWGYGGIFEDCTLLETIPDKLFYNNTKAKDYSRVFYGCTNLKEIPENTFNTTEENVSMYYTFCGCKALTKIKGNISKNIPSIGNMSNTFSQCSNLTEIENGFVIPESVTNMQATFGGCKNLAITITLKSNQATYNNNTFNALSKSTLNWAEPCTEEKVDEILAVTGGIQKGSKVD